MEKSSTTFGEEPIFFLLINKWNKWYIKQNYQSSSFLT
ncbi:hypothetical protein B4113_3996 [Geobacillus sp. B4113_201601]|nr:hypothetical protein B4113_3996 [Geobacillus sp. B4113_201601]